MQTVLSCNEKKIRKCLWKLHWLVNIAPNFNSPSIGFWKIGIPSYDVAKYSERGYNYRANINSTLKHLKYDIYISKPIRTGYCINLVELKEKVLARLHKLTNFEK